MTLFKTQVTILEMLVRNTTDAVSTVSGRLRGIIASDPRRFYYPCAIVFIILISVIIHLALPTRLVVISANMANLAALKGLSVAALLLAILGTLSAADAV